MTVAPADTFHGILSASVHSGRFLAPVTPRSREALNYLSRTWIAYDDMWVAQKVKWVQSHGIFMTSRLDIGNNYLIQNFSVEASLVDVFRPITGRIDGLNEVGRHTVWPQDQDAYK